MACGESDAEGQGSVDESVGDQSEQEPAEGLEVDPTPELGTADDSEAALEYLHGEHGAADEESEEELSAIDVAIIQALYFEAPSAEISDVRIHKYSPTGLAWKVRERFRGLEQKFGIVCDVDVPESILGPALLKTRRIFSDNQNSAYQANLRSGRVNAKVLGKRAWSNDDRLFAKKRVPAKKDYAVLIMMDISSSNLGDNLALLKRSVFAQAELCQRVGVKFSIVAHSASINTEATHYIMDIHEVKGWDEPWAPEVQNRVATLVGIGGNLDGHAMEYGRNQLAKVSATDKIMLYYTDGKMPAANADEELEVLQAQIKHCKRDAITILGVGIRTDSPIKHGLDTVQVDNDDDLQKVVQHLGSRLARAAR